MSGMRGARELVRLELDQAVDVGQRRTGMDRGGEKALPSEGKQRTTPSEGDVDA